MTSILLSGLVVAVGWLILAMYGLFLVANAESAL